MTGLLVASFKQHANRSHACMHRTHSRTTSFPQSAMVKEGKGQNIKRRMSWIVRVLYTETCFTLYEETNGILYYFNLLITCPTPKEALENHILPSGCFHPGVIARRKSSGVMYTSVPSEL